MAATIRNGTVYLRPESYTLRAIRGSRFAGSARSGLDSLRGRRHAQKQSVDRGDTDAAARFYRLVRRRGPNLAVRTDAPRSAWLDWSEGIANLVEHGGGPGHRARALCVDRQRDEKQQ